MVDRLPETFDHDFNSFVSKLAEKQMILPQESISNNIGRVN